MFRVKSAAILPALWVALFMPGAGLAEGRVGRPSRRIR